MFTLGLHCQKAPRTALERAVRRALGQRDALVLMDVGSTLSQLPTSRNGAAFPLRRRPSRAGNPPRSSLPRRSNRLDRPESVACGCGIGYGAVQTISAQFGESMKTPSVVRSPVCSQQPRSLPARQSRQPTTQPSMRWRPGQISPGPSTATVARTFGGSLSSIAQAASARSTTRSMVAPRSWRTAMSIRAKRCSTV